MSIPNDFINYRSTSVFTKESVPKLLLYSYNTKAGVYGKISVLTGSLKFYGLKEHRGEAEKEIVINEGESAVSPPQYWHKVELLTNDTTFKIDFYAQKDSEIVSQNQSERDEKKIFR